MPGIKIMSVLVLTESTDTSNHDNSYTVNSLALFLNTQLLKRFCFFSRPKESFLTHLSAISYYMNLKVRTKR